MYKYKSKKYYREDDFLVAYYSDVLKLNPSSPLFLPLADIYYKNNRLSLALQTCQSGLEKMPNYSSARFLLAQIYHGMEENDKAAVELEKVLKKKPDNIGATSLLADISMRMGNVERSRELFTRLIDLNPNDKRALTALSHLPSDSGAGEHAPTVEEDVSHPVAELEPDIADVIETGEQVMLGKDVAPVSETVEDEDELLMPEVTSTEELAQQLEDFDKPEETVEEALEEVPDEPEESIEEEPVVETSPEEELEEISEEEILEAFEDEGLEEVAPQEEEEQKEVVEIKEPEPTEELLEELDEESLPPLPTVGEESPEEAVQEDFSASLIDDERPLEAIGEIFQQREEAEEADSQTEEIVEKKQKVINNLEGWLKKLD